MKFSVYGNGVTNAFFPINHQKAGETYPLVPGVYMGMTLSGARTI